LPTKPVPISLLPTRAKHPAHSTRLNLPS
jgi:hypothetical protein